jgi:hypothetical protein
LTVSGPLNAMENCAVSVVKFLDLTCTPEQSNNSIRGQIKIIGFCRHLSGEAAKLVTGVPDLEK